MRLLLSVALLTAVTAAAACGWTRTAAEQLAWERWQACSGTSTTVVAKEISPDGRLLLHGDPTAIARVQACLAQVAEEQGRHLAVVEPPPALKAIPAAATAVPTRTLFGLAFKPEVGVADVAAVLAFIAASAAGWVALGQLRAMTSQARWQMILEIDRRWDDDLMEESRIAVLKAVEDIRTIKRRDGRPESEAELFTEHLGRLWREDLNEYQ
jgi:hypothetical protein